MALAVNSVVSYSARPLVYISYFGLAVTLVAMLYVAWVVVRQLLYNVAPPGWPLPWPPSAGRRLV